MNPCQDFEKSLPAYQEGLISGQDKKDLEDHLRSCEPCRLALGDLTRTKDLLGRLPEVAPPPWFTQKVMARVREETVEKRGLLKKLFYPLPIKIPLGAMASILVVILAVYVYQALEPEMPPLRAPAQSVSPLPKDFAYREKEKEISPAPAAPTTRTPPTRETKTTTSGRLEKEQGFQQPSGSGAFRDKKLKEPGTPVAPLKKMEPSESKPAPALGAAIKEKDRAQSGILESLEEKGPAASDRSTVRQGAVSKSTTTGISIRVRDVRETVRKALELLQQVNAKNVQRERAQEMEIITAAVASPTIPNLLDQLNTLGEVRGKVIPPPTPEGPVSIRIEIIPIIP